jgi:hypothetical protein
MTIKTLINDCIKQNNKLLSFLNSSVIDDKNTDGLIIKFKRNILKTHYNPVLCAEFASLLQLSNDPKIFEQYELEDISRLFDSLIELDKTNLSYYYEAASFELAIKDNPEKASELIEKGLEFARNKIDELNTLKTKINKNGL